MKIISTSDPTAAKTGVTNIFTQPQIISTTLPDFPYITLIDDFHKANGPLASGWVEWPNSSFWSAGLLTVSGNRAVPPTGGTSWGVAQRADSSGYDLDAVVEFEVALVLTDYIEIDLITRSSPALPMDEIGAYIYMGPGYMGVGLARYKSGSHLSLGSIEDDFSMLDGLEALGARVCGNTVSLWLRNNGVWTEHLSAVSDTPLHNTGVALYLQSDAIGELAATAFYSGELPNSFEVKSDGVTVASVTAGGIFATESVLSGDDEFLVSEQHTFTAKQTFDPSNSDPAIVAIGGIDVTGSSEISGTTLINPTVSASDGSVKRILNVYPEINLSTGSDNTTEITGINNEIVLSSSSTYKPAFFNALASIIKNTHASLKLNNGYAGYFNARSENGGGFSVLAAVRALLSLDSATVVDEAAAIKIEGTDATGHTVGSLTGVDVGYQRGATANYAIRARGGQSLFETGAAAVKALILRAFTGQSANIVEVQDSTSTNMWYITGSGNMYAKKHIAVGNSAVIDSSPVMYPSSTFSTLAVFEERFTDLSSAEYANNLALYSTLDPDANATAWFYGIDSEVTIPSTSTKTFPRVHGIYAGVLHNGSGLVNQLRGIDAYVASYGYGHVDNYIGVHVDLDTGTDGTVSNIYGMEIRGFINTVVQNWYGLYIRDVSGAQAANYSIFTEGGQVRHLTGASGTIGMVIKGAAGQSANLQEWQTVSGTVVASIDSNGNLSQPIQTLTDAATISWDLKLGGYASLVIGGNRTLANPTNMVAGAGYTLKITQDGTGSRTLGFGSAYKWAGGAPALSTAAGSVDIISFVSDGTNMYGSILKGFV